MKKNRTLLGVALLIAVLVLGVGYAALTASNLYVDGSLTVSQAQSDFVVVYDEDIEPTFDKTGLATASYTNATTAKLDVTGLKYINDEVTATFTVRNDSKAGINADLSAAAAVQGDNAQYYSVTTNFATATGLEPGNSTTMTVTVKLVKTPVTDITDTFNITLTATPVEAETTSN